MHRLLVLLAVTLALASFFLGWDWMLLSIVLTLLARMVQASEYHNELMHAMGARSTPQKPEKSLRQLAKERGIEVD